MTDLTTLRDRLAAATGADRELDFLIDQVLGLFKPPTGYTYDTNGVWRKRGFSHHQPHRDYTANLDAALALVERVKSGLRVCGLYQAGDRKSWSLTLVPQAPGEPHPGQWSEIKANGRTAPIAVCRALLNALIAEQANG